jgi:hypothetical protein|nr:MAG TPA: tail completion protein [Caudoviricetes sp.]
MSEEQLIDKRYRQTYSFTVLYWPKDETEPIKEINSLQCKILDALEYIRIGDLIIRGENRSAKITDLVLSVFVDFSLHVFKPKGEAELQMNLVTDARVKGD